MLIKGKKVKETLIPYLESVRIFLLSHIWFDFWHPYKRFLHLWRTTSSWSDVEMLSWQMIIGGISLKMRGSSCLFRPASFSSRDRFTRNPFHCQKILPYESPLCEGACGGSFFLAGVRKENGILVKALLHKLQKYAQNGDFRSNYFRKPPLKFWIHSDVVVGRFSCAIVKSLAGFCRKNSKTAL